MESTHTPGGALMKLLAIVGFFAVLALLLWLLVQGVRAFPTAFSSLASIVDSISNYSDREFSIAVDKPVIDSGESLSVTWTDMRGSGTYHFGYSCVDDMSVRVRTDEGTFQDLTCTEDFVVPATTNSLILEVSSEEVASRELPFTVRFDAERGNDRIADGSVIVMDGSLALGNGLENDEEPQSDTKDTPSGAITLPGSTMPTPAPKPTPSVNAPTTPAPTTPAPTTPAPTTRPGAVGGSQTASAITIMPRSYENGFTDLRITFLDAGTIEGGRYTPKSSLDNDDRGAFRFEVKNIGTKTSREWTYALKLPGGVDYTGDSQAALTPNERAVFTVSFEFDDTYRSTETLAGTVSVKDDTNVKNNTFSTSIKVTN